MYSHILCISGKMVHRFVDIETQKSYQKPNSYKSVSLTEVEQLDDNTFLFNCYDDIIRVHNIHTGISIISSDLLTLQLNILKRKYFHCTGNFYIRSVRK